MDKPDADPKQDLIDGTDAPGGGSSSLELGNVKKVLSVKLESAAAHYTSITPLGKGSFGEVHSALDTLLGREVAIKSLKAHFREEAEVVDRFLKEARGTAQLEHPNIMPVHEMGVNDDLGIYFTMKKIQGETLKEILDQLDAHPAFFQKKYSLNVLLEIFLAVCNGVAFAHSKGVIHRDLKPSNIMTGEYGEVLILDWGLVKQLGAKNDPASQVQLHMDEFDEGSKTLDGAVSGTPNYMSPEQAEGRIDNIDFQSDVYSLGAILYHMLTYVPPFEKTQLRRLLENVKTSNFESPRQRRPALKIPRELEAICLKAMALHPVSRYRTVEHLAQDIRNYIGHFKVSAYKAPRVVRFWKGCKRNPIKSSMAAAVFCALALSLGAQRAMLHGIYADSVGKAVELLREGNALVAQAMAEFDQLEAICLATEAKTKSPDELASEERLNGLRSKIETKYNLAISRYLGVPEIYLKRKVVREGYTQIVTNRIGFALHQKRYAQAQQWKDSAEPELRRMGLAQSAAAAYLADAQHRIDGDGSLSITGPASVRRVMLYPLENMDGDGCLKLGDPVIKRSIPCTAEGLTNKTYMLTVESDGLQMLPFPVYIDHSEKKDLDLQLPESIPAGMVYVPGGDFFYGGEESRFYRKKRKSLPAFFIKKYEVTFAEYLDFWKTLKDPGLKSEYNSRVRFLQNKREFTDAWDDAGQLVDARLKPEFPVVGITLDAARAFCDWKSRQTGTPIRLPTAEEWEKAARGVDGRTYVWGNGFSENRKFTNIKHSNTVAGEEPSLAPPGSFRTDCTVYNAYDMAGNAREMTTTPLPDSGTFFQIKGGSASTPATFLPCCYASDTPVVPCDVGFRYIQEIPAQ